MHSDNAAIRQPTSYRTGVLVALAGNLMWSCSLWLLIYLAADIVADYYVWLAATAVALLITLIAGAALQRHDNHEEVGDGVLRGAAILAILYTLWHCCAIALFTD
jgi:hypothetical protein